MRLVARLARLALPTCLAAGGASAQTVAGLALDDSSHAPLAGSTVRLLDRNHRPVAEARADSGGAFYLTAPAAGEYRLLVRRPEGGAFRGRTLVLTPGSVVQEAIAVPLLPAALRAGPFADEVTRPAVPRAGNPGPHFPVGAWRRGERGMVMSFVVVRPDGKPDLSTLHLIATSDEFAHAVRESMRTTRFLAAERDGRRIAQVVQLSYAFGFAGDHLDGDVRTWASRR
jgi:hypothetical protein